MRYSSLLRRNATISASIEEHTFLYIVPKVKGPAFSTSEFLYSLPKQKEPSGVMRTQVRALQGTQQIKTGTAHKNKENTPNDVFTNPALPFLQLGQDRPQVIDGADGTFLLLVIAFIFDGQPARIAASFQFPKQMLQIDDAFPRYLSRI